MTVHESISPTSTPPPTTAPTTAPLGVTVQASSMLLCSLIAGAASTVALGIVAVIQANASTDELAIAGQNPVPVSNIPLIITASIFVVSWIAVAFSFCRDQVLHRVTVMQAHVVLVAAGQQAIQHEFAALRAELAEYAEQRETDGFLHGRRSATTVLDNRYEHHDGHHNANGAGAGGRVNGTADVRPLYRVPPVD